MNYPTLDELRELSVGDHPRLLDDLWSTFDDPGWLPVSEEQRQELDRRLEAWERNPTDTVSWPELKARIARPG